MPRRFARAGVQGLASSLALLLPVIAVAGDRVDPRHLPAPAEVQRVAQWIVDSRDNQRRPYLIVDKANARVYAFDARSVLKGEEPVLLGMGSGDFAPKGAGARNLAQLGPRDRVTPAGRFLANLDRDARGQELLLIDYEQAIALHPVVKGTALERRAERLASATSGDNRISFGCINVPAAFYRDVVSALFKRTDGYVYILPESGAALPLFVKPAAPQ